MGAPLATLAQVKAYLGNQTDPSDDELLTRLIDACSSAMEKWCSRNFGITAYSLTQDGNGRQRLTVEQHPLVSVSSVMVNGNSIPASTGPNAPGYFFSGWNIHLRGGFTFDRGVQNVAIECTAGYAETPPDVVQACVQLTALRYKDRDRLGLSSKSVGGEGISFTNDAFPESIQRVLNDYKGVVTL